MTAPTQAATPPPGDATRDPETLAGMLDDLRRRWREGEATPVETYLKRNPELNDRTEEALVLIYQEIVLREQAGQSPRLDEYQRRFPRWAGRLADQFEVHRALGSAAGDNALTVGGSPVDAPSGRTIAGCEVLEVLGRGGMGIVYRAWQPGLNRIVALKMVLAGAHAAPSTLERFRAEAEAAARLQHPNIVQVFQIAEHDGVNCLVLEYVPGRTLAQELAGTPQSPTRAAQLVELLARTMHYAHGQGVVHRDLKPGNVLLTADGTPKIADFGLAKLVTGGGATITRTGDILGTPSYMAPEQAGGPGRIGPGADVYALGAILYEMLGGRPPFRAETPQETLRQIVSEEPVPPSRLRPRLARDLETICLRCLEKDPAKRYDSSEALADDLRRFLDGRPIQARRVGSIGRLVRWARRHPAVASLSATVVLLAVAAAVGLVRSARNERQLRVQAEENLAVAQAIVDQMYTKVAEDLEGRAGMDAYQRELLEKALQFYRGFALHRSKEPELRFGAAATGMRVGDILNRLGRIGEAETAYRDAVVVLESLTKEIPAEPRYQDTLATGLGHLGLLALATARTSEAEASLRRAVGIRERLAAEDPRVTRYRSGLAADKGHLSIILRMTGRMDEARVEGRSAQALGATLVREEPDVVLHRRSLASAYSNLGLLDVAAGRLDEAERNYDRARALFERLVADNPRVEAHRSELAQVLINVGNLATMEARWADAEAALGRSGTLFEGLTKEHPDVSDYRKGEALALLNLGELSRRADRPDESVATLRKATTRWEELVAAQPQVTEYQVNLALSLNNLGLALRSAGRADDAESAIRRALSLREQLASDHPEQTELAVHLGGVYGNMGLLCVDRGQFETAIDWLDRADRVLDNVLRREPRHVEARQFRDNNRVVRNLARTRVSR